jgi:hypothetical protein
MAAVHPAGPEPMIIIFSAIFHLHLRKALHSQLTTFRQRNPYTLKIKILSCMSFKCKYGSYKIISEAELLQYFSCT